MEMAIWRGDIEDLTPPDAHGTAECRLRQGNVRLHPDLTSSIKNGDKVLVAGSSAAGVLHAMAVHNLTRDKLAQIDPTNQVLLAGLWGFIALMSGAFGWPEITHLNLYSAALNVLAIAGIVGVVLSIQRITRVTRAANWIKYPDLQ